LRSSDGVRSVRLEVGGTTRAGTEVAEGGKERRKEKFVYKTWSMISEDISYNALPIALFLRIHTISPLQELKSTGLKYYSSSYLITRSYTFCLPSWLVKAGI